MMLKNKILITLIMNDDADDHDAVDDDCNEIVETDNMIMIT